jgi:hypothetical protein
MSIKNSELIDLKTHTFKVLDFITIQLFGGFLWQGDDIERSSSKGSGFWAFNDPPEKAVVGIVVVVTDDDDEVNVSLLNDKSLQAFDELLRSSNSEDKEIIEWLGSRLIISDEIKKLETQYIYKQDNKISQNIEIRFFKAGKKIVVLCNYDLALKDPLARLVSHSLQSIKFG